MTRARRLPSRAAAALAATLVAGSCREPAPPPETRLLVLDGIEITLAEVEPYVAFFDSYLPEIGRKTKVRRVLDEHLLPLRIAQRAFPEQRRLARERAVALREVATNVLELEQQSSQMRERQRSDLTRNAALLPVAMFAFDPLQVGGVSEPLEVPHGFLLVGVHDLHESPALQVHDYVDVLQVGFLSHRDHEWRDFFDAEKARLADKATFVHPDYVHAMPAWLRIHQ